MRNMLLIAKREYMEQIRSKSFRITTYLVPIVAGGMLYFLSYMHQGRGGAASSRVLLGSSSGLAYIMGLLLTFVSVMYGMNVGRSIIGEKTSRIFEVMLATVKPEDMMFGKLLGVGAVGLTQIGIWIALALAFLSSKFSAQIMPGGIPHIPLLEVVLFCVYFLLGYLFYSSLSAGLASTVSTEQELQQFWPINAVPVWLSFGMIPYVSAHPNGGWALALSCIAPSAPITVFIRLGAGTIPAWQIALSIAAMAVTIYAIMWLSSRLYRVGILMYGKRASFPELLRWLRYS